MVSSKSWSYLFTTYGYGDNESGSRNARSYPLSYVYSGNYYWEIGRLYNQTLYGFYWPSTIYNSSLSYALGMYGSRLFKADTGNKRVGFALRCVARYYFSIGSLGARSYPLSYVYSGYYYWDTGRLYFQTVGGYYWSSSIVSSTDSYALNMNSTRLVKARSDNKRIGFALRCIVDSILTSSHNARETHNFSRLHMLLSEFYHPWLDDKCYSCWIRCKMGN